ncbi:hypothetical protein [Pseudomonas alkylphenolica]|uniref:Uncharacterized protein n=1 Tax=Pseudomonas alkylphenolica TaxID=237609 RepID=A0A077FAX3_9PSED|nr:hypothetical protein [Pseudomonas alkylphenolica]AIL62458.1 hypothetical protein PSAKL28_32940 [Pseudomonas alkylphenolica]
MAASQSDRSAKTATKRKLLGEEELRMRARQGTRNVLAELMECHGIEEQTARQRVLDQCKAACPSGAARLLTNTAHHRKARKYYF